MFFVCLNTDVISFPFVVMRLGQRQACDEQLFLLSALDFAAQLSPDALHAFRSTFQAVADVNPLYATLLSNMAV